MTQINIPIVNAPYLSVDNLQLAVASTTTMTMAAGRARNSTNVNDIILEAAVTINAANNGINGLDTGALANATLYAVYAVGDSSGNNDAGAVLSASATEPLMPVGYDMFRKIGYVRTDGSAHFLDGYWSGNSNERVFMYDAPIATAVTAGAATSYTAVSLNTFVPEDGNLPVWIAYAFTPAAASRVLNLTPGNATGDAVTVTGQVASVVVSGNVLVTSRVTSNVPEVDYKVSNADSPVAVNVAGYQYSI